MIKQFPDNFPTIVCLCGSTRFSEAFHEANLRETLAGRIVLSIGCDFKSDTDLLLAGELSQEDKTRLDELHMRKIDLADEVLILNVKGYIGDSTRRELIYAILQRKSIRWLEPDKAEPILTEIWPKHTRQHKAIRAYFEFIESMRKITR